MRMIILFFGLMVVACAKEKTLSKEDVLKNLGASFKKEFDDQMFKANGKCQIFNMDHVSYDTINTSIFDTTYYAPQLLVDVKYYTESSKLNLSLAESNKDLSELIGSETYENEFKESKKNAVNYLDSSRYYMKLVDSLYLRAKKDKNPIMLYRLKTYLKVTCDVGKGPTNTMDTLFYFFTTDYKKFTPSKPVVTK